MSEREQFETEFQDQLNMERSRWSPNGYAAASTDMAWKAWQARAAISACPVPAQLDDIEQYRMQMAAISTAALGYWKAGDPIKDEYVTVALKDVAELYKKYDELYKAAAHTAPAPAQEAEANTDSMRKALQFYADGSHFVLSDESAWDTVSGEPLNFWCDEAGTATVEDGSVAKTALAGIDLPDEDAPAPAQPFGWVVLSRDETWGPFFGASGRGTPPSAVDFDNAAPGSAPHRVLMVCEAPAQPAEPSAGLEARILAAIEDLTDFSPAYMTPLAGMVRGGAYVRKSDVVEAICAALKEQS